MFMSVSTQLYRTALKVLGAKLINSVCLEFSHRKTRITQFNEILYSLQTYFPFYMPRIYVSFILMNITPLIFAYKMRMRNLIMIIAILSN